MDRRMTIVAVGIVAFVLGAGATVLALRPDKSAVAAKGGEAAITLTGTVQLVADANGGAASPLNQYVGQSVTITGKLAKGSNVVHVMSVNGTAVLGGGKPTWAGGGKAAGAGHPGWSKDKAARMKARFGDCFPPGQCKDKSKPDGAKGGSDEPEGSEAP